MKHIRGKRQIPKVTPEDSTSILPEHVITNILDCLPIKDAVRTCILSRKWRYKWTALTQLVFDENFARYLRKSSEFVAGRVISRLLLHIKGGITKFVFYIPHYCSFSKMGVEDINNWVMLLSTKGIRELTLINMHEKPLIELSTHLLSCTDLKHLTLSNCCLRGTTTFRGFPNLLTLDFNQVRIEDCKYGELITSSTSLEVLKLNTEKPRGNVKLVEIAKLENLKVLSIALCELDSPKVTYWHIFQLLDSLRKLTNLFLDFQNFKCITGKRALSALPSLKSLSLCNLDLSSLSMVLFALDLIQSSPSLQTLKIMAAHQYSLTLVSPRFLNVEWSIISNLKQLRIVEYGSISNSEIELCLIESLLAYCSSIKKMVIYYNRGSHISDYYLDLAEKLIEFPRASPIAKVNLVHTHENLINLFRM